MTHLVQILLPLADNAGKPFPDSVLAGIQEELSEMFGGLTAYSRAPAKGIWKPGESETRDDIIVLEVMADRLDTKWWKNFRHRTETLLRQDKLVVRAQEIIVI
jgi:hypothetical protein